MMIHNTEEKVDAVQYKLTNTLAEAVVNIFINYLDKLEYFFSFKRRTMYLLTRSICLI